MKILKKLAVAAVWIGVWELASLAVGADYLRPGPLPTARALAALAVTGDFWLSVWGSLRGILAGFLAGTAAGLILGSASGLSKALGGALSPLASVIKATPVASFILLALVFMKKAAVPPFSAALIVAPVVWKNVNTGFRQADPLLLEMAESFKMPFRRRLAAIYIPGAAPYFRSACVTSLGMAWKAGVAAEVICAPHDTIGRSMYLSKIYFETPELFAWTFTVIIISFILELLLGRLIGGKRNVKD